MRCEVIIQSVLLADGFDDRAETAVRNGQTVWSSENPLGVAMNLPCVPQQFQERIIDRNEPLTVSFSDFPQEHGLGIDRVDGESNRFA